MSNIPDPQDFVSIVEVDDWGNIGYYLHAEKSAFGTWSHSRLDQAFRLKEGDDLEVLWPDGTLTQTMVMIEPIYGSEDDGRGVVLPTTSDRLSILVQVNGSVIKLTDFSQIKVRRRLDGN